jgi:very-short-patch-repair endonuclease
MMRRVRDFGAVPFRGSTAVAAGVVTWSLLRGRRFNRLFPDVYVAADATPNHQMWCEAALMSVGRVSASRAGPGVVAISGVSAAALYGVEPFPDTPVELTVPRARQVRGARLVVVRSELRPSDLATCGRMSTTSPERTVFDLARRLPRDDAVATIDALLHRGATSVAACLVYAQGHRDLAGCRSVAPVLAITDPRSESPMESRLRLTLVDGGLPRPESQVEVRDERGRLVARLDLAYRERRIGIEYEGDHHRDPWNFRRDIARINALQALGWTIIRVTADDIRNPARLFAHLRRLLGS